MSFNFNFIDMVNILFIANGVGVCFLCILIMFSSSHIRKEVRRYFILFFALIEVYIMCHLAREILNGMPGDGVRNALYIVTFFEVLAAGVMAHMMSVLVITVCKPKNTLRILLLALGIVLIAHIVLLAVCWPFNLLYYFDANNEYNRGNLYLLTNLGPVIFLVTCMVLLIKYRQNVAKNVKIAFWVYMIAPIVAIIASGIFKGIQFIIFATVLAAVYMFGVIIADQNSRYREQLNEKSRIETELGMASSIQADMLPNVYPAFPDRPEFDIFASMDPAKEVGGDFYDFFLVDDDHLGIVIADVSGKGVPAALFMMASKIILANNAMNTKSPAATLTATNNAICANNREEMFVTVWLGILELSTGKLKAANAGHEFPAICKPNGEFEMIHDKHGFVIGGIEGINYQEYELTLEPGSKLFIYTDGVPEAKSNSEGLFGLDRLVEALNQNLNKTPQEVVEGVRKSVDGFVKNAEQFDDLTMLCMEYKGKA